jgi:RNA polymerase sigma-70 factor, ECF subfamily
MPDIDIETLIAKTALSNRNAFDSLYQAVSPKLFAVTMRILKNRDLAEDALQEVFVKIWQKAESYRAGQQAPMSWLVTIARNHAIDVIRANKRKFEDIDEQYDLETGEPNPEQNAINSSERNRINRCLEELEPQKAEAVVSAYMEGYSYQELAERYAIPLNTMRTWLRRSLLSLKDCLDNG